MLISKKIVYYFASWILHDFKKRKKVKNKDILSVDIVI